MAVAAGAIPLLPEDILHMISIQLWHQRDFNTLFNCALASKILAIPALANIYRMHNVAPVTSSGSEEVEITRQSRPGDFKFKPQEQEHIISKWAGLWKTMILSSLGKTAYPYCRYIRALDLRDLKEMLEDTVFRNKFSDGFFSGELSRFKVLGETRTPIKTRQGKFRPPRLDPLAILIGISEEITKQTPMLEDLSGEIPSDSLSRWIPRLPKLQNMTLWSGAALANGVGQAIRTHCPNFKSLTFFGWSHPDADLSFAAFLNDLKPQTLQSLEVISYSEIGTESFSALNCHSESLVELQLKSIKSDAMPALSMLKGCTALTSLVLAEVTASTDLETTQNDVFLEVVAWLKQCKGLHSISIQNFLSAPAILTPILLENDIRLVKLEVTDYIAIRADDFHQSLAHQLSLRSLLLEGDGEDCNNEILVGALCKLTNLTYLRLNISDLLLNPDICKLAQCLQGLEEFWTGGYNITDAIWKDVGNLKYLRKLDITALSRFTVDGLLEFISNLGPGNWGLSLAIMMADAEDSLTELEQQLVRETLAAKVEGRFEYTLAREPDAQEFGESDSD